MTPSLAVLVPVVAVLATALGLLVFGRGLAPPHAASQKPEGTTGERRQDETGSQGHRPSLGRYASDYPGLEATRLWGIAAATAGGFGGGLSVVLFGSVRALVLDLPANYTTPLLLGSFALVVVGAVLARFAPVWFRAPRMVSRGGRQGPDSGIKHFNARQVFFGVLVGAPLLLALVGVMGSALASVTVRGGACTAQSPQGGTKADADLCSTQITALLELRRSFLDYLLWSLVMLVLIMLVIALAQRALKHRTEVEADYYRESDVLLFGAMLSILMAIVLLPAYAILQESGYDLTNEAMESIELGLGSDWFDTWEKMTSSLSPAFGPRIFVAGLLTIATPLLTGALTAWLSGQADKADQS